MLGILGIQIYWIINAVELRREKFDQTVMESLENAMIKLEKKEAISTVLQKRILQRVAHKTLILSGEKLTAVQCLS